MKDRFIARTKQEYLESADRLWVIEAMQEESIGEHHTVIIADCIQELGEGKLDAEEAAQVMKLIGECVYKRCSQYAEDCAKIDALGPEYDRWKAAQDESERVAKKYQSPLGFLD